MKKRYSIGIDPGKNTGFAVYDRENKSVARVDTFTFWSAIEELNARYPVDDVHRLIVELPRSKHVWHNNSTAKKAIQRASVDVGGVLREGELLVEYGIRSGYAVLTQHPQGKRTAAQVKKITGYQGRTNSHTRDAIMLAWGV